MTDFAAEAETLSTTIDTDTGPSEGGGGQPDLTVNEPASLRSDLETVFKEADKAPAETDDAKPDDAAKVDGKAEEKPAKEPTDDKQAKDDEAKAARARAEDGKFAKPESKDGEQKQEQPKEGRRFVEAPQSFLPQAREVWRNTPHAVQTEVARLVQEQTEREERTRTTVERYETLRQFDDLARTNGRDLRESLEKLNHIENTIQRNPLAGLNEILREIGPRKADGQPYSLYEVAQYVAQQDPQSYQQQIAQGQQQQEPREDPRISQLQQQLAQVQEQTAQQTIIEPFAREHPRYQELEGDIAFFLQSGKVPTSLSPYDRLAAAYDMAERINPPSHASDQPDDRGLAEPRRVDSSSGSKSIKSSPGSVAETFVPTAKSGESTRDSLLAEMRRINR